MTQNRTPPAYQEYPANWMSLRAFREMTLAERGLLQTLRFECWVNGSIPAAPNRLARMLGQPADEVAAALPAVQQFFSVSGDDLVCPELEDYREHLARIRRDQQAGGKVGAKKRWNRKDADQ
jgi:hypothetical protein